jgi:hypothetical protein
MAGSSKKTAATLLSIACVTVVQFLLLDAVAACEIFNDGTCPTVAYPCAALVPNSTCACDNNCETYMKCCPVCGANKCVAPTKPGICPDPPPGTKCGGPCQYDYQCDGDQKCCHYGCRTLCMPPVPGSG